MKQKLLVLIIILLAACSPKAENPAPSNEEEEQVPEELVLKGEALALDNGLWRLDKDSVDLQEREAGLILSAQYVHDESGTLANLTLTRYRDEQAAGQIFAERQSPEAEKITALGEGAFLLGEGGMVLADVGSIAEVQMVGADFSPLDVLGLLQVGMEALLDTEPAQNVRGYLGAPENENEAESDS